MREVSEKEAYKYFKDMQSKSREKSLLILEKEGPDPNVPLYIGVNLLAQTVLNLTENPKNWTGQLWSTGEAIMMVKEMIEVEVDEIRNFTRKTIK